MFNKGKSTFLLTRNKAIQAEWLPLQNLAVKTKGDGFKFGFKNKNHYFYPIEVLYMVQHGDLILTYKDQVLNLEKCFEIIPFNRQILMVYTELKERGFMVSNELKVWKPNKKDRLYPNPNRPCDYAVDLVSDKFKLSNHLFALLESHNVSFYKIDAF